MQKQNPLVINYYLKKIINKELSNQLPSDKIEEYNKSKFKMNHNIDVKVREDVRKREKQLIHFIEGYFSKTDDI